MRNVYLKNNWNNERIQLSNQIQDQYTIKMAFLNANNDQLEKIMRD